MQRHFSPSCCFASLSIHYAQTVQLQRFNFIWKVTRYRSRDSASSQCKCFVLRCTAFWSSEYNVFCLPDVGFLINATEHPLVSHVNNESTAPNNKLAPQHIRNIWIQVYLMCFRWRFTFISCQNNIFWYMKPKWSSCSISGRCSLSVGALCIP